MAANVRATLARFPAIEQADVLVVFTAHSLPESILERGEPYDRQLRETARLLAERLALPAARWTFSYQSAAKTGVPWLGPQIEELVPQLAAQGERNLLIAPIGFIADHVEVLYDIDIGVQHIARDPWCARRATAHAQRQPSPGGGAGSAGREVPSLHQHLSGRTDMSSAGIVPPRLRLGTRGSALARWQTDFVADLLRTAWPELVLEVVVFHTRGDRILDTPLPLIGGKGLFTAELEAALHGGVIDLAVHSLKDLPTTQPAGLAIGAVPLRADARDVVISRSGRRLDELPASAVVGTSSRRRAAQLLLAFPHLCIADLRGNVDTRLRKALEPTGPYDAISWPMPGWRAWHMGKE